MDRSERLDAISAAVESVARSHGFSAVTIRRVADELGASTTVVTHYFSSRSALVCHVVGRVVSARTDELDAHLEGLRGRAALRAMAGWVVLRPSDDLHRLWLAIVVGAAGDDLLRTELDRFNRWWDERVERHLAELDPPDADPGTLADLLDVVVAGLVVAGVETDALWDHDRRRAVLDRLLVPIGLGEEGPPP